MTGAARSRELHQITGETGSGKTTLMAAIIRGEVEGIASGPECGIIVDPLGHEPSSLSARLGVGTYTSYAELHHALRNVKPGQKWWASLIPPTPAAEVAAAEWAAQLARWAGEHLGDLWLVYEEAGRALPHGRAPETAVLLAQRGRHYGVSMMTGTQRPISVAPDIRAELRRSTWIGRLTDTNELRFAKELRGKDFAERVANLAVIDESGYADWIRLNGKNEEAWRVRFQSGRAVIEKL